MAKAKAVISLPEEMMTRIDLYGSLLQMSRSQVVEAAVKEYLDGKVAEYGIRKNKNNHRT